MTGLDLVIFDCDGVLVDSEAAANRVVAEELTALGWTLTAAESQATFLGMTLTDMEPLIAARLGALPSGWTAQLAERILAALAEGVPAMPGAAALLRATTALGLAWRVASNSSRLEMQVKFAATGLDALISMDRVHSAGDVIARGGRGKPAPDLFLAAAAAEGVRPERCLVVEDSVPGARGAAAAAMRCLGFAPHGDGARLRAEGAEVVNDLAALPALFQAAMQGTAMPGAAA